MNRGLYSAATGMSAATQWLDVISHNLANISTTGFKRDEVAFNEGLDRQMARDGGKGGVIGTLGSGPVMHPQYTVMEQGTLSLTGNPTDFAIAKPDGMFAVQTASGTAYTRDGSFAQDNQGFLTTQSGDQILDRNLKPIQLKPGSFVVAQNGEIMQNNTHVADIGVFTGNFSKIGDSLFTSQSTQLVDSSLVDVRQGALEQSNVNAISEMVAMIRLNRAFEMAQKSATSQDDASDKLISAIQN